MTDYIVRATAADSQIRAFAATTREMTEYARKVHEESPVACAALGRLMTAGAMMGAMMKGDKDLLTLQIRADGPLRGMTVTADAKGNVKGFAGNPQVMLPPNALGKLDVGGAVGHGILNVIKDMGMKEPYVGQVGLQTGEIAEDLTYYFATSEQVASSVGLGVLMNHDNTVRQAGGFIIQLMLIRAFSIRSFEQLHAKRVSVFSVISTPNSPSSSCKRSSGVIPASSILVTDFTLESFFSRASITFSSVNGISWMINPPA